MCQPPSLIWPTDISWCVATEVDFDSTLIAGDNHLIDAVLGAEVFEATPIEPGDCLDSRGDTVNAFDRLRHMPKADPRELKARAGGPKDSVWTQDSFLAVVAVASVGG